MGGKAAAERRRQVAIDTLGDEPAGILGHPVTFREYFQDEKPSPYRAAPPLPGRARERMLYGVPSDPEYALPLLKSAGKKIESYAKSHLETAGLSIEKAVACKAPEDALRHLGHGVRYLVKVQILLMVARNLTQDFADLHSIQEHLNRLAEQANQVQQLRAGGKEETGPLTAQFEDLKSENKVKDPNSEASANLFLSIAHLNPAFFRNQMTVSRPA
jgi:hypothetical protein